MLHCARSFRDRLMGRVYKKSQLLGFSRNETGTAMFQWEPTRPGMTLPSARTHTDTQKEHELTIPGSSNGRTPPFGGGYLGSNPGPGAMAKAADQASAIFAILVTALIRRAEVRPSERTTERPASCQRQVAAAQDRNPGLPRRS